MSGLSRTPGKRVGANNPPRVRIPLSPPVTPLSSRLAKSQLRTRLNLSVYADFFSDRFKSVETPTDR
jgi:hypothetical protein